MLEMHPILTAAGLGQWLESIPEEYRWWVIWGSIALIAAIIAHRVWRGVSGALRRRRPANIHPLLQKYNVDHAELDRNRRKQAAAIVATSTGNRLAGFRIVRQVEAVFVEGYRTPDDALIALKATAVERGANALLNVTTARTAAGRCTASADAVVVSTIAAGLSRKPPATPAPPSNPAN